MAAHIADNGNYSVIFLAEKLPEFSSEVHNSANNFRKRTWARRRNVFRVVHLAVMMKY